MKVLFQNRPKNAWIGGDWVQLEYTANALRKLGVEVDIVEEQFINPPERLLEYDFVHLWNFSMIWTKYQLWCARKWKKPVICSMIYHEDDGFVSYPLQQIMMNELSYAIFQTKGESERTKRHLTVPEDKIVYIPNGIDPWWLEPNKDIIWRDPFVLTVGRIEPFKGQLACAKACKELGIDYICIGEGRDEEYLKQVKDAGAIILPKMTKEQLKPYYHAAKVYVQPSRAETWGLAIDEAMSQGTPCVLTSHCERDDFYFPRCEYDDVQSIKNAILTVIDKPKDFERAKKLKTWDDVAKMILEVYKKI